LAELCGADEGLTIPMLFNEAENRFALSLSDGIIILPKEPEALDAVFVHKRPEG